MIVEVLCLAMFTCMCVLLLAGFPVAFTLAGVSTLFALIGYGFGVFDLVLLNAFPSRLYALMTREPLVAVPLFVFMGVMLERSRIASDLLDCLGRVFAGVSGGLAVSVSIVGMLLAASTGIVGASVVTLGLLSLPAMLSRGYSPAFASGTVAAAGTLGQIIPPSIVLIFLGDQLSIAYQAAQFAGGNPAPDSISVNDLFAGALFPGLLLVALYIAYQIFHVRLHPLPAAGEAGGLSAIGLNAIARSLLAPLALIVAVLGSILAGIATATEAASVGAVGAVLLAANRIAPSHRGMALGGAVSLVGLVVLSGLFDLRPQRASIGWQDGIAIAAAVILCASLVWCIGAALWRLHRAQSENGGTVLPDVLRSTLTITAMIFAIVIGASLFALVFRGLGGARLIETFLADLPGGAATAVFVVIAVMFVLGFFLDFLEIVFVVVPIVAPILLQMDMGGGEPMNPVWLGVMMALVLQTSFLTPPFGFALFYLRGVAPDEVRTLDIYRGVVPFVSIQLLSLAIVWFAPAIATWLPDILYSR